MAKKKEYTWEVALIRGIPAGALGRVVAVDEESAITRAAQEFDLSREQTKRLVVRRLDDD
jgi:hypothetical protein